MNTTDLMADPYYAGIMFQIESLIAAADQEAKGQQMQFTDSQIRSVVVRARKQASGGKPDVPCQSPRDQALAALFDRLIILPCAEGIWPGADSSSKLPVEDWGLALRAVEDSIRLRTGGAGSRDYLDFLEPFIEQAARKRR